MQHTFNSLKRTWHACEISSLTKRRILKNCIKKTSWYSAETWEHEETITIKKMQTVVIKSYENLLAQHNIKHRKD